MRDSEVGVRFWPSCCREACCCEGDGRALLLAGVEGGRMGVGCRLLVDAIGTSLNVLSMVLAEVSSKESGAGASKICLKSSLLERARAAALETCR